MPGEGVFGAKKQRGTLPPVLIHAPLLRLKGFATTPMLAIVARGYERGSSSTSSSSWALIASSGLGPWKSSFKGSLPLLLLVETMVLLKVGDENLAEIDRNENTMKTRYTDLGGSRGLYSKKFRNKRKVCGGNLVGDGIQGPHTTWRCDQGWARARTWCGALGHR